MEESQDKGDLIIEAERLLDGIAQNLDVINAHQCTNRTLGGLMAVLLILSSIVESQPTE